MYSPQNYFLLRIPDNKGRGGNPSAAIDVNAFRTTNFRSQSAMRGAEFHGNSRPDSTTHILSIDKKNKKKNTYLQYNLIDMWVMYA